MEQKKKEKEVIMICGTRHCEEGKLSAARRGNLRRALTCSCKFTAFTQLHPQLCKQGHKARKLACSLCFHIGRGKSSVFPLQVERVRERVFHNNSDTSQSLLNVKHLARASRGRALSAKMTKSLQTTSADPFNASEQDFAYSPIGLYALRKCKAFTLAEVLITLAVIGIVAAMTIPNLVQNYKKKEVETKLVKFYSMINQALTLSEVDNGDKSTWHPKTTEELWAYFEPYIKYNKVEEAQSVNHKILNVYLPDGAVAQFAIWDENSNDVTYYSYGGHIVFYPNGNDVLNPECASQLFTCNGTKRFFFGFWPNDNDNLHPGQFAYHKDKGVVPYVANWNGDVDALKTDTLHGCNGSKTSRRLFCTKLIELNDWKIPEDYPFKF